MFRPMQHNPYYMLLYMYMPVFLCRYKILWHLPVCVNRLPQEYPDIRYSNLLQRLLCRFRC